MEKKRKGVPKGCRLCQSDPASGPRSVYGGHDSEREANATIKKWRKRKTGRGFQEAARQAADHSG